MIDKKEETEEERKARHKKLGDLAEALFGPIANKIDKTLGTNIKECGGCKKRKEWLNQLDDELRKPFDD